MRLETFDICIDCRDTGDNVDCRDNVDRGISDNLYNDNDDNFDKDNGDNIDIATQRQNCETHLHSRL